MTMVSFALAGADRRIWLSGRRCRRAGADVQGCVIPAGPLPPGRRAGRQPCRAGQPHQHSGAEVERPVVPATVGNGLYPETGQLRELLLDETTHLFHVDGDALWHGTEIRCVTQRDILSGKALNGGTCIKARRMGKLHGVTAGQQC
jgi:hypothetical protein